MLNLRVKIRLHLITRGGCFQHDAGIRYFKSTGDSLTKPVAPKMIMAAPNRNLGFPLLQQRRHLDECAGGGHALTSPVRQDGLPLAADQSSEFQ